MRLKELLKGITVRRSFNFSNAEVAGLAYDSRKVRPGYLFVAISGTKQDGHAYIQDALLRGAEVVVVEKKDIVFPNKVVGLLVDNSREALAVLSTNFFREPSRRLKVIGITGTKGKTTTAYLVHNLHQTAGEKCGLIGTIAYQIGERQIASYNTTPESLDLQEMMSETEKAGCQTVVMEVSSHGSDQGRVAGIHFDSGLLTNVSSHEHLDYHGSFAKYLEAKIKFFKEYLATSAKEEKLALINLDDPSASHFLRSLKEKNVRVVTWGKNKKADVILLSYFLGESATVLDVSLQGKKERFSSPLKGLGNVFNLVLLVAYGWARHFPLELIHKSLVHSPTIPGRFEMIDEGQPFSVVVDYAHTADSLRSLLVSVRAMKPRRVILVFGCGGDRDRSKRPLMGKVAARLADLVIITSDNPRSEDPFRIIQDIRKGIPFFQRRRTVVIMDRRKAIQDALELAQKGDFVVIAGKGHETYQIFRETVVPFDDRIEARKVLERLLSRDEIKSGESL
ncbi:MAG: UDP-N-acetylmuramoyl-L-alanyl-D-glutamate--2,6-diaminopimelate ligase [Candidatus Omnitrophica bacterium]|nr:UDP-N-acetylmuramoyl-L-alanyl-D-glutamate--2,6-diaminopimelate ligase [Candidatus Omnitrophota bacterium]